MDRGELNRIQLERLKKTVNHVYNNPFYKKKFDEKGITPNDIKSLEDISLLPFTTKNDLRDNYPFGLFCVPMDEIVRVHCSSGTTGKPVVAGYTRNDIGIWAETMARTLGCGNVTSKDKIQIAYGYGLFTGGLGAHYGAEKIGAMVIPVSAGNTKRQLMLMKDFGTDALCCTPSYSLYMAEAAKEEGINFKELPLRVGLFGAEPWTNEMRNQIEEKLNIKAIDIYGLTEIIGPGVSSECLEQNGLHIFEDHFYPEIINPDTGEVLPYGEIGELVFTCITKEAFPLIRYRTRDITKLNIEQCPCGRTSIRMNRISGRTDDMLIIRGVNVFPSQIEEVLLKVEETEPHYQIIVEREGGMDILEIQVEVSEEIFSDEIKNLEAIKHKIKVEIESVLGVSATIKLVEPKSIQRSEGKAKRVFDNRKLN